MKKLILINIIIFLVFCSNIYSQTAWTQVSGIHGGRINYFRPFQERIFAIDAFLRLYYSDNKGINWNHVTNFESVNNILTFNSSLFATGLLNPDFYFGLVSSDDNGITWEACTTCPTTFSLIEANDDFIFAESEEGLYRSTDGVSWTHLSQTSTYSASSLTIYNNQVIYKGLYTYYSIDNGDSWTQLQSSNGGQSGSRSVCMNDTALFEISSSGIFYSLEVNDWISLNKNLPDDIDILDCYLADNILFIKTSLGLYYLSDQANTWQKYLNLPYSNDNGTISIINDDFYYIANIGLFYSNTLWENWQERCMGFETVDVHGFCVDTNLFAVLTDGKLFTSIDNGVAWESIPVNYSTIPTSVNRMLPLLVFNNELLFSTKEGHYVYNLDNMQLTFFDELPFFHTMKTHDNLVFACSGSGLYYRGLDDLSWQVFPNISGYVYDVSFSGVTIFVSCENQGVICSSNLGLDWSVMNEGLDYEVFFNDTIYLYPQKLISNDKLYGLCRSYSSSGFFKIQYYNEDQERWFDSLNIPVSTIQHPVYLNDFKIVDESFYLSCLNIFKYSPTSSDWIDISGNLWSYGNGNQKQIYQMTEYDNKIFVSVENAGIWQTNLFNSGYLPDLPKTERFNIYPNPGVDFYTIFNNGELEELKIKIFDISGRTIKETIMRDYSTVLDIHKFPQGLYLIQVKNKIFKVIKN